MPNKSTPLTTPLPKGWPARIRSAMLHAISLGRFALACSRAWAVNCPNARVRLKAELDRANQEVALLREEN